MGKSHPRYTRVQPYRWDSPLLVERAGVAILPRALGVNDHEHWNIHVGIALGERWHTVQKTRRL